MKRIIAFIALIVLMVSCGITKKAIYTESHASDSTSMSATVDVASQVIVDTTKTASGKVTVVEIEFYEPENTSPVTDSTKTATSGHSVVISGDDIRIDNASRVKMVKTTTIETSSTDKGESRIDRTATASVDSVSVSVSGDEYNEDEIPVASPNGKNLKATVGLILGVVIAIIVLVLIIWRIKR